MLHLRILPWLWELDELMASTTLPPNFDYKGLFLWLDSSTMPEIGIYGPLMGIANRRRIWGVCQQLLPLYKERLKPIEYTEPTDAEANAVLQTAVSLHTPIVMHPQPEETQDVSAQFIRSWGEISRHSCDLDTYWNNRGALVGIAVTFGAGQRVFGHTDGRKGLPLHLEAGDWIKGIIVGVRDIDLHHGQVACIVAMGVSARFHAQ
jgi:hypothetical protein